MSLRPWPVVVTCAVAMAGLAGAAEVPLDDWRIEYQDTQYPAAGVATLVVDNPFGDVRVEGTPGETLRGSFGVQRHREDPRELQVRAHEEAGVLHLEIGFTKLEIMEHEEWAKRRIDAALTVPNDLRLEVTTDAGDVEVEKFGGDVDVTSARGDVSLDGGGALMVEASRGAVRALIRSTEKDEPLSIETLTGDITVTFEEGARFTADVETYAHIASDYSIAIDRKPGSNHKTGRIEVDPDGRHARLTSHQGTIRIHAIIVPEGEDLDPD